MRQGPVDSGFNITPKAQDHVAAVFFQPVGNVIPQHFRRPAGKHLLASEVLIGGFGTGPQIAPLGREPGLRYPVIQSQRFRAAQQAGAPAYHYRCVKHHHATDQVRTLVRRQQGQAAAHRMTDQNHRLRITRRQFINQFLHQRRPAVGDGILWIMGVDVERAHVVIVSQVLQELPISS